ncbi:MAG: DegT/DnrJ/EryC1/StrS aminotransferase family protein [Planctomycetes bacterium]|nr:DegT/DnrJ/EryC1/StrS aminotransferase family protein [Planctomycetota bacterium]
MTIPVFRPSYGEEEFQAVREVMASGWVGLGPKTAEFEKRFAEYLGVRHAVALNSGTAALHLAMVAAGLGRGDEVISTPLTFVSTNHAILYVGARPVFADVEAETANIDPRSVRRRITKKTRAIVCVHYGGRPCKMDELEAIAREHDLALIEDAAHGCGGEHRGRKLGAIGRFGAFSFHAVKNLATGEGGAIVTNDDDAAARLRKLRWLGISRDTWTRGSQAQYSWYYTVEEVGFKYHMNDIPAAIGLVQLARLDEMNARRAAWAARYDEALRDLAWIQRPAVEPGTKPDWHNYVIQTDQRDALNAFLAQRGIATGVHYIPNNHYDMYKKCRGRTPVCERIWKRLLTLPLYPDLAEADFGRILAGIREFGRSKGLNG